MMRPLLRTVIAGFLGGLPMLAPFGHAHGQTAATPPPSRPHTKKATVSAKIAQLVQQLGSDSFVEREAASKALDALGEQALRILRKLPESDDLEIRHRVAVLLKSLRRKRIPARNKAWAIIHKFTGQRGNYSDSPTGGVDFCCRPVGDDVAALLPCLDDALGLCFQDTRISDKGLSYLETFYRLHILNLEATPVTDAGLTHVGKLSTLATLILSGTKVNGTGLVHLKGLTRLTVLDLNGTLLTDAGMRHVNELKKLSQLRLSHTRVTDGGLDQINGLKKLCILDLSGTRVTDAGLAHLKALTSLYELDLSQTSITDAGLVHLKAVTHLGHLNLSKTQITDAGLAHLKEIRTLTRVDLTETKVTDRGRKMLRKSLPGLILRKR